MIRRRREHDRQPRQVRGQGGGQFGGDWTGWTNGCRICCNLMDGTWAEVNMGSTTAGGFHCQGQFQGTWAGPFRVRPSMD